MLIQIQIDPHTDNRLLKVSAVSELFSWHGEQRLGGEESPRTVMFEVRHLPAGDYCVKGEIIGPSGRARGMVSKRVTVLPRGAPAEA
jgi:hypothetical protein